MNIPQRETCFTVMLGVIEYIVLDRGKITHTHYITLQSQMMILQNMWQK